MDRQLSHAQIQQLLGAFALDALDPDEARTVAEHLGRCPRCTAEVDDHHQVAAMLANSGSDAPSGLWDRIAIGLDHPPPAAASGAPGPMPPALSRPGRRLPGAATASAAAPSGPAAAALAPPVSSLPAPAAASARRRRWRWRWQGPLAAVVAAAAATVIAVLAVQVTQLTHRIDALDRAGAQRGLTQAAQAAALDPAARRIRLADSARHTAATLVVLPSGAAFFVNGALAALPPSETYQLWGMVRGRPVSLGLLGPHPATVALTVNPSAHEQRFAVTAEPAGGVVQPTATPVAAGAVT